MDDGRLDVGGVARDGWTMHISSAITLYFSAAVDKLDGLVRDLAEEDVPEAIQCGYKGTAALQLVLPAGDYMGAAAFAIDALVDGRMVADQAFVLWNGLVDGFGWIVGLGGIEFEMFVAGGTKGLAGFGRLGAD